MYLTVRWVFIDHLLLNKWCEMQDELDAKIVEKLSRDGRTSLTNLSFGIDLSRVAVANRIDKLIRNNLLKISAMLNLEKLNHQTLIVELQAENKVSEFKKLLQKCPKILHSFEITGPYNHMLICSAKNNRELRYFIENVLKKYGGDCKVTLASNPLTPEFAHVKPAGVCSICKRCGDVG